MATAEDPHEPLEPDMSMPAIALELQDAPLVGDMGVIGVGTVAVDATALECAANTSIAVPTASTNGTPMTTKAFQCFAGAGRSGTGGSPSLRS
jgi:hypothetical protein